MTDQSFGYRTTALQAVAGIDLSGRNTVVTGSYSGVGLETVRALASAGATVTIACRDLQKAQNTAAELNSECGQQRVIAAQLDLGSLASIKAFTEHYLSEHNTLELLINNGAIMACPYELTVDGFESQFGVNYIGHFALTRQLLPALIAAQSARVVCLSSTGHFLSPVVFEDIGFEQRDYDPWQSYGQSKTACSLLAVALQDRYKQQGIEAFAVHPGGIMTTLQRHMSKEDITSRGWVNEEGQVNEAFKSVQEGASTSVWAATAAQLTGRGGRYLEDCGEAVVHSSLPASRNGVMDYAVDVAQANQLWDLSEQWLDQRS